MATALKTRPNSSAVAAKPKRSASRAAPKGPASASLTLSSKNYSSWSLRGWLMTRLAGLDFDEVIVSPDDASARKEILLLSPSILVPCLTHAGIKVWDTLAIGEYLAEIKPKAGLLPADIAARAHCRAICGEMHSGFSSLRSALPMNLKGDFPGYKVWARAEGDIERITAIWSECIAQYGGPFLFGEHPCMADAMYAPVVTRFRTYHVKLDRTSAHYCDTVMAMPEMKEWIAAAKREHEDIEELDMEF
ncbi:MAG: glutathione S-transferase family protein [Rhizobacter sp.]|jgi:glutathione S-transferase|nr:glutathione S-transferase family protein [Rhizobacter sp.]HOX67371.1 glutathione S-transferase family protein [Burkholderiaceae bacterium]